MVTCAELKESAQLKSCADTFTKEYMSRCGLTDAVTAHDRIIRVLDGFQSTFGRKDGDQIALFSAPGRTEILGNHTDHQHGHVLCASVNIDILACAAPNNQNIIRIHSVGYPEVVVELNSILPIEGEEGTTAALVRGVVAEIAKLGYKVSGFDAYMISDVLSGSGLSSSAAFEVLIGNVINAFFCAGQLDAVEIAKIGQYAENVYFGKPCGLMDQIASAVGGVVSIDFADPAVPCVKFVDIDLNAYGHELCIIDTGSCHADLTDDFADITREMGAVAAFFGKKVLREVPEAEFTAAMSAVRDACGDRAVQRAMHFYADDLRAELGAQVLEQGDFGKFLSLVNESGRSSEHYLQNICPSATPNQGEVSLALEVGKKLLDGVGAIRVHGGGFAGTVQAFVPAEKISQFKAGMEEIFGPGSCHILRIRPCGGCAMIG